MTDTSQAEIPPQTNGLSDGLDDEERSKMRPADIDADVREMERRKRVEHIMNSKIFREELERIIESQLKDGNGASGLLQQISDMVGVSKQSGNMFKNSSCVVPINDIRGIEAIGYSKGEKMLRCKLAALFRLINLYGWTQEANTLITARLNQDEEVFLVNPYGMLFHEMTASSLIKVDMQGSVVEQGTTNFTVNVSAFSLHAAVHAARPDIKCIINIHTPPVVAISALKQGLLPLSQESVVIGEVSTHTYLGGVLDPEEKDKLSRNLGPNSKVLLLSNQGALCCGETIEEAFFNARNTVLASESQLKLLPLGLDNLILLSDEARKKLYDAAHKAPESSPRPDQPSILEGKVERKWRVGGVEFEALMRMLDNAGFRTGYIYRHPLVKGEPPRPKNDVEVPPAVSSLGYLLEEEELYRQGLWRKLEGGKKGHDRSRWLNSPNVYQKVEILETGTMDPKKITKWVADGSPTHSSTPVKIENALQFVPKGTNPKEFKLKQQEIKDYRRADKLSAGPQSHILEGVTWEEARKMQDASVTQTGDQVVLMGAASKGIIQRGHQHNAMVYKSPYAKNPFDSITDEELDEYKKVVEKKVKGEYDTDFSESELSSAQINKRIDDLQIRSPTSVTSETEEESRDEPQILRIETSQAPVPSQPEVVLSDGYKVVNAGQVNQHYYRTNSHAGLPKGSYTIPNPTHFHIARQTEICTAMRPNILTIRPGSRSFNNIHRTNNFLPTVTINFNDVSSVSFKIPMQIVTGFIYPFASALNILNVPLFSNCNQGSQTAFVVNGNSENGTQSGDSYTPLVADDKTTTFERRILDNLQQNLLSDLNLTASESDVTDAESFSFNNFTEVDFYTPNESMVDITSDVLALMPSSSNSSDDEKYLAVQRLFAELPFNLEHEQMTAVAEAFSEKLLTVKCDFKLVESVVEEAKELLHEIGQQLEASGELRDIDIVDSSIVDEGIVDCAESSCTFRTAETSNVDNNVMKMSQIIFDYLVQQCFEVKELVLFPEVLYDSKINKLLAKLKSFYDENYGSNMPDEQKNEFRISIFNYVMKLLEVDETLANSSPDSSIVSDKIFTISEFLSDILDNFFNVIDNNDSIVNVTYESGEQFLNFSQPISKLESNVFHSTPEKAPQITIDDDFRKAVDNSKIRGGKSDKFEIVTPFKKGGSAKSGTETYWMAISNLAVPEDIPRKPRVVLNVDDIPLRPPEILDYSNTKIISCEPLNVDEIPLKPPPDLEVNGSPKTKSDGINILQNIRLKPQYNNSRESSSLSPIIEEPRCNLFGENFEPDSESEVADLNNLSNISDVFAAGDSLLVEKILKGHSEVNYVSVDGPEVNTVICNEVNFFRTQTTNSSSYVKAESVVFKPKSSKKVDDDDDFEGDWMGYKLAKF